MKPKKKPLKPDDGTTIRAPWMMVPFHQTDGQAHIDGVMQLKADMDRQWGIGRLRLVVSDELRAKFDRQQHRLIIALNDGSIGDVKTECARMTLAYRKLNEYAMEAGVDELEPEIWEVALNDGTVAALVQTNADAARVLSDGRQKNVFTLQEIATLIDGFPALVKAKQVFSGARIVKIEAKQYNDDIPNLAGA